MYNLLFYFLFVTSVTESKRILAVFPIPSFSHQIVYRPVMQELAKRGHQVTVITPFPEFTLSPAPPNLTEVDIHDMAFNIRKIRTKATKRGILGDVAAANKVILEFSSTLFEDIISSTRIQSLIYNKTNTFDLIFVENLSRPSLAFSYLYKVPVIQISPLAGQMESYKSLGAVTHPIIYPLDIQQRIFNLTIWEKLSLLYTSYSWSYASHQLDQMDNKMLKTLFGINIPYLKNLENNIHLTLFNVHPVWDFNRPVSSDIIYFGDLHQRHSKPLSEDIETYLQTSKNGVIYVSFGTNVDPSQLDSEKVEILTKVFSKLPYDILWKWDEELLNQPKNVKISKWFSQENVLNHSNTKLFITQGGLLSTYEAIEAGVPLICIPMFWDQWFNAEQYVHHNIGKSITFETIAEDVLEEAIYTVIENESFRENVVKLRNILHDRPQTALQRAAWWTEHVLRHGGDVIALMRPPAAGAPWTEHCELELLLILATALIVTLKLVIAMIRWMIIKLVNLSYSKLKIN